VIEAMKIFLWDAQRGAPRAGDARRARVSLFLPWQPVHG